MNEFWSNKISVYYQGLKIIVWKKEVYRELSELRMGLSDVKYVLENGFDCPRGKRKKGVIEKCIKVNRKVIKVVVEKAISMRGIEYWKLKHVGIFGFRREWYKKLKKIK
jgi:hypothetical protein